MVSPQLRINAFLTHSLANGPGMRAVIWVQGCSLGCRGCFNPLTHPATGGQVVSVGDLFDQVAALDDVEGVTVSGGEPLQQLSPLLILLQRLRRRTALSTLVFSGYTWEEVQRLPQADALLACVDVLLAGRYDSSRHLARDLRGSANKTVHFLTDRYTSADLETVPPAEVVIAPGGEIRITGVDPPRW
jgi:anaerobic ribonucleoside-triphosphate reductase activating protein